MIAVFMTLHQEFETVEYSIYFSCLRNTIFNELKYMSKMIKKSRNAIAYLSANWSTKFYIYLPNKNGLINVFTKKF